MPQTTPERAARWGDDQTAIQFLRTRGFTLTQQFFWIKPSVGYVLEDDERDAITYLIEEWDFGGAMSPGAPAPRPLSADDEPLNDQQRGEL